jgi:hypothetical protein
MLVFLLTLVLTIFQVQSHKCGFSPSHSSPSIIKGVTRETNVKSIRITPIFTDLSIPSKYLDSFKYNVVNGALSFYSRSITLKRLSEPLNISTLAGKRCGPYTFSENSTFVYENTDVLIFIGAYEATNDTSALSFTCAWEDSTFKPLVGYISYFLTSFDSISYEYLFSTMMHSMAHILVFNSKYFSKFTNSEGPLTYDEVVLQANERDTTVYKIQTPGVKSKAQKIFSCTTLDGLELETESLSHWEKRLMNDEFMTIDSNISDIVYSPATFALFEDSGWYSVDYDYSSSMHWGKDAGCAFTSSKCVLNQIETSSFFNVDVNNERCDYKRLNRGKNNLKVYTEDIPQPYQYYPNTKKGGDPFADYCPFIAPNDDGNCRGFGPKKTSVRSQYGESIGENSRCIEGNFTKDNDSPWHATCHEVVCHDTWVDIKIGDILVRCEFGVWGFPGVTGYSGGVECADTWKLCNQKPCPSACSGFGVCEQGVCKCDNGDSGGDCTKDYSESESSSGSGDGSADGSVSEAWIIEPAFWYVWVSLIS